MPDSLLGHNSQGLEITVEVRLFNSVAKHAGEGGAVRRLTLPAGGRVGDVVAELKIPREKVFLALVNGRDVTPGLVGAEIRTGYELEDGDVVALSGPVPFSYGYGAPVV